MRWMITWVLASCSSAALVGCPAPPTPLAVAQQTAQALNVDMRFGRTELAMEHVAPAARDDFASRHRAWGTTVRLADVELAGMRPRSAHDVEVLVRVAWYRQDEQDLRVTTVQQRWRDTDGWQLVGEQRVDGDVGLLGERIVYAAPSAKLPPAQFPTVRLGGAAIEE